MKKLIKLFVFKFSMMVLPLFFRRSYLTGRWFRWPVLDGIFWAWRGIWWQKIWGFNRRIPWPVSPLCSVGDPRHIRFHPDNLDNFQSPGCYFQSGGPLNIGYGVYIAPNVGLINANHDPWHLDRHVEGKAVTIGDHSWIGMNAVILPGVVLGERTVVGAGSVVTKSFPEGHCVIAGNPARCLRRLENPNEEMEGSV